MAVPTARDLARESLYTETVWQDVLNTLGGRANTFLPKVKALVALGYGPLTATQALLRAAV